MDPARDVEWRRMKESGSDEKELMRERGKTVSPSMKIEGRIKHIRRSIPFAMLREQELVMNRLGQIARRVGKKGTVGKGIEEALSSLERRLDQSIRERRSREAEKPFVTYPE